MQNWYDCQKHKAKCLIFKRKLQKYCVYCAKLTQKQIMKWHGLIENYKNVFSLSKLDTNITKEKKISEKKRIIEKVKEIIGNERE